MTKQHTDRMNTQEEIDASMMSLNHTRQASFKPKISQRDTGMHISTLSSCKHDHEDNKF